MRGNTVLDTVPNIDIEWEKVLYCLCYAILVLPTKMLPGHVRTKVVSSFLVKFLKVTMLNSTKLSPLKARQAVLLKM